MNRLSCIISAKMALVGISDFSLILVLLWSCWHCASGAVHAAASNYSAGASLEELQDRRILTAFKQGIVDDPTGALASWRSSQPVRTWKGVACAPDGRVISLRLPGKELNGSITPLLLTLPFLRHVNLSSNSLQGSFPDVQKAPGNTSVSRLVSLDLSGNFLSGTLPDSIGALLNLQVLSLASNDFEGPIPLQLGLCHKLVSLELGTASDRTSSNRLNGTIPGTLANCSSLTLLRLSYSALTGPIPAWLGLLKHLQVVDLASNLLTGQIPASLGNLTSLAVLQLMDNGGLGGEIPGELRFCNSLVSFSLGMTYPLYSERNEIIGSLATIYSDVLSNMTATLRQLVISGTLVTGSIPEELGTFKWLVHLDLWANFLTGEIPHTLGNLSSLQYLDLTYSDFTGSIPREIGSCGHLRSFFVGRSSDLGLTAAPSYNSGGEYLPNKMTGSIPEELGRLPLLTELGVHYTSIGGQIPYFRNSTSLVVLRLDYNDLTGGIPTDLPSSLVYIDIRFNRLSGPIPAALGNLSNLVYLAAPYNDLEGTIPIALASCKNMEFLSLGGSSMSSGPKKSNIVGSIPKELGQLGELVGLHIWSTQVSGTIPRALGNCTFLSSLLLGNNNLSGSLPAEISNMTKLIEFGVTTNGLEGSLSYVEWNMLQSLQYLDLSRNNFSGYIDDRIGEASSLKVFLASETNLVGSIPLSFKNCCSALILVDLQHNQLSGNISDALDVLSDTLDGRSIMVVLLSSNRFQGTIPLWVGSRFKNLFILGLANMMLEGRIPYSVTQLARLQYIDPHMDDPYNIVFRVANQYLDPPIFLDLKKVTTGLFGIPRSMTILDLSNNNLKGEIPSNMSSLQGLRYLNLSGNHFTGPIPLSFSNLSFLIQMDLSNNSLTGIIPPMLSNLSKLDYLDLSNNNLIGQIPFGTRFSSNSYLGNMGLCGEILNTSCSISQSPLHAPTSSQRSSPSPHIPWSWVAFSIGCATSFLIVIMLFLSTSSGLYYIFGDMEPPFYIRIHGFYEDL